MTGWEYVEVFAILAVFVAACVLMVCSLERHHERMLQEQDDELARGVPARRDRWAA